MRGNGLCGQASRIEGLAAHDRVRRGRRITVVRPSRSARDRPGVRPRAGLWGLDVDPRHGGERTLRQLQNRHGPLPRTLTSRTGSGGWHLIFTWPQEGDDVPTRSALAPGVDVRGAGGYLVLPPSPHVSGQSYAWVVGPGEQDPAQAPEWLLKLVRQNGRRIAHPGADGDLALVPAGRRHDALVSFCGLLRSTGLGEEAIVECGHAFLRHQVQHDPAQPLDLEHAERTMRSIARRYPPHHNRSAA